uniref:Uncharacterized protein n=1 Tax=Globodera rostochiensis TaxID=31243 RepID=A0A914HG46_GLORO
MTKQQLPVKKAKLAERPAENAAGAERFCKIAETPKLENLFCAAFSLKDQFLCSSKTGETAPAGSSRLW